MAEAIAVAVLGAVGKPLIAQLVPVLKAPFSHKQEEKLREVYEALSKHSALDFMLHPDHPGEEHENQWEYLDLYRGKKDDCFDETLSLATGELRPDRVVKGAISMNLERPSAIVHYKAAVKKLLRLFVTEFPPDLAMLIDVEAVQNFDKHKLLGQFNTITMGRKEEYSVCCKPSLILRRTKGTVIAPIDQETMRLIAWARNRLHMGNEVQKDAEIRHDVCWNVFISLVESQQDNNDGGAGGGIPEVKVEGKMVAESIAKMRVETEAREGPRVGVEMEMGENLHVEVKGNPHLREEVETAGNLQADAERNHRTKMERLLEKVEGACHEAKDRQMKII